MRKRLKFSFVFMTVVLVVMISLGSASAAAPGDIIINEVMQNPDAVNDSDGEWFEVFNPTATNVDIEGWTIKDDGTDEHVINNGVPLLVPAGGYLVLGRNGDSATNGGVTVDYEYADIFLGNSDDELILIDTGANPEEINRIEWDGGPVWPDPTGASMAFKGPDLDNNDGANWCTSPTAWNSTDKGTPGAENDCPAPPDEACGDTFVPIYEARTMDGVELSTEGVVTGDFQGTDELGGFFLQDPDGDGDDTTSDGIFIADVATDVAINQKVRVHGAVDDRFGQMEIGNVTLLLICEEDADPIAPTELVAADLDLSDMEAYEGMLIKFTDAMYASDTFNLHRFGEVTITSSDRQWQPTNSMVPGPLMGGNPVSYVNIPGRIILDDGSTDDLTDPPFQPAPYIGADDTLRLGDTVTGLTGNMGFGFSAYRIQPTETVTFVRENDRQASPDDVGGTIKVASFNVWNYWTTLGGRGADTAEELVRQTSKLVPAILGMNSDVIALQELENNGDGDDSAIHALVEALNAATAPGTWDFVREPDTFESTNAIKVGIIYQTAKVDLVGDAYWDDDPVYDISRPPIAQTFDARGEVFTVVSHHFKSKGCFDDTGGDTDQDDGQSCYNETRTQQAEAALEFVAYLQEQSDDDDVIVLGDLNSYAKEDPVKAFETGMVNHMNSLDQDDMYSFVFFGQAGLLDYAITTEGMADRVKGVDVWHINPDEPRALDYTDKYDDSPGALFNADQWRSSDHDPALLGFCDAVGPEIDITLNPDMLWPPNHRHHDIEATVEVEDNFDPSPVLEYVSVTSNEPDNGQGDGNTTDDIVIVDDFNFKLRAERSGKGSGRIYTVTYKATDSCGNVTEASEAVVVPHDMRDKNVDPRDLRGGTIS